MTYDITIAVHCWRYSRLLAYQLGSLIRWPPKCSVLVQVFCARYDLPDDRATIDCVDWHAEHPDLPSTVKIERVGMVLARLKNRSIGRNLAALSCESRLLYFSDCDYVFGPGYLDAISKQVTNHMVVAYPRLLHKCPPCCGDDYVDKARPGELMTIDVNEFKPERLRKAIGGVQIIPRWIAKKYGYLPDSRRHQSEKAHWVKTTSDVVWRKGVCRAEGVPQPGIRLDLPPVYRIRHSECGRDNHDLVM